MKKEKEKKKETREEEENERNTKRNEKKEEIYIYFSGVRSYIVVNGHTSLISFSEPFFGFLHTGVFENDQPMFFMLCLIRFVECFLMISFLHF